MKTDIKILFYEEIGQHYIQTKYEIKHANFVVYEHEFRAGSVLVSEDARLIKIQNRKTYRGKVLKVTISCN